MNNNNDTSKATGRPWRADGFTVYDCDGFRRVSAPSAYDTALIVERVNGWEALEAERDAFRASASDNAERIEQLIPELDAAEAERNALREALVQAQRAMAAWLQDGNGSGQIAALIHAEHDARAALGNGK